MHDFHYNLTKKNFDVELLFTDTDSLTYEIKSENVYEEFFNWKDFLIEFVGLKSKRYSMIKIDGKNCNTAKGASIATEFDKFKDILFNEKIIRRKMKRIQNKKHKLGPLLN